MNLSSAISPQQITHSPAANIMPLTEPKEFLQPLPVQFKLRIGSSDDPFEHEADSVADKVMRMPETNFIQRKCRECEEEEKLHRKPITSSFTPLIQTKSNNTASDSISQKINSTKGGGSSMDSGTKTFMESRFGTDFSGVKIHTGDYAVQLSQQLSAQAFTVGSDIYFDRGEYNPNHESGRFLLAHELTHVVQQNYSLPYKFLGKLPASQLSNSMPSGLILRRLRVEPNYDQIAHLIHEAISGLGTDEEAVYLALQQLRRDQDAIALLKAKYQAKYDESLEDAIYGDFSGTELEYALQLLNMGRPEAQQAIEQGSPRRWSADHWRTQVERLRSAVERWGTDEEAIYAVLIPLNRDQNLIQRLKGLYFELYRENLRERLLDELSGSELNYALYLTGEQPTLGNVYFKTTSPAYRQQFIERNFPVSEQGMAARILEDLFQTTDELDFANEEELRTEIAKRMRTSRLMQESQRLYGRAFEYPNHPSAKRCLPHNERGDRINPRVNKAAERYWGPVNYEDGSYYFELSEAGKENAYEALRTLFTPQSSICDMTLIHCDYLASVVHFRTFAETIGIEEFNRRVKRGTIVMRLTFYGFQYLMDSGLFTSRKTVSLQSVRPSSERDLVIGDHVIFWNHRAYDLINVEIRNAWRLENAILIDKQGGEDIFLGHGSGRNTNEGLRRVLVREYNDVVHMAQRIIHRARSSDHATASVAHQEMRTKFPYIQEDGTEWKIKGRAHGKTFDEPLRETNHNDPDLTGLHDPEDPSRMNEVKRPIESAED